MSSRVAGFLLSADTDGDWGISNTEVQACTATGLDCFQLLRLYLRGDANRDGTMALDEVDRAVAALGSAAAKDIR